MHEPVALAEAGVHETQSIAVTLVESPAHPNPIDVGRICTSPGLSEHDSTSDNGADEVVVLGGGAVVVVVVVGVAE